MLKPQPKKSRINLSDYPYEKDLENRLQMASFSPLEIDLLDVILNGSLTMNFQELEDELNLNEEEMILSLEKFARLKLLQIQGKKILINKEMRKYYELHISRFSTDFEPSIEFLQGLLNQVPIHLLPVWYTIPKNSTHIIQAIINKHLLTPKIYERYLQEIEVEEPLLYAIASEVFASSSLSLSSSFLKNKYQLKDKEFAECVMRLEFNLLCCSKYERKGNGWEEMLIPFHEWSEFLLFKQNMAPSPIKEVDLIENRHPFPFGFVHDLTVLTRHLGQAPIPYHTLQDKTLEMLPHISTLVSSQAYLSQLSEQLIELELAFEDEGWLRQHPKSIEWLQKDLETRALGAYQSSLMKFLTSQSQFFDKDTREILKFLKSVRKKGWIYYQDFLKGFTAPIGRADNIMLVPKGKRWRYTLPSYSVEEMDFLETFIFLYLLVGGIVSTGTHKGKRCFCITSYGYHALDDYA